jgi:hypothetical protein
MAHSVIAAASWPEPVPATRCSATAIDTGHQRARRISAESLARLPSHTANHTPNATYTQVSAITITTTTNIGRNGTASLRPKARVQRSRSSCNRSFSGGHPNSRTKSRPHDYGCLLLDHEPPRKYGAEPGGSSFRISPEGEAGSDLVSDGIVYRGAWLGASGAIHVGALARRPERQDRNCTRTWSDRASHCATSSLVR